MSLTLSAALVAELDLLATVGGDAALALDALLAPDSALTVALAGPNITATLGPFIEVVGGGSGLAGIAGGTINGHRALAWAADGTLVHADPLERPFAIAGITEGAAVTGGAVSVVSEGVVTFSGWSWTAGPVYLGLEGAPSQVLPSTGYAVVLGRGEGTRLFVNIQPPVAVQ